MHAAKLYRKATRRETLLAGMNTMVPRSQLAALIETYCSKSTSVGERRSVGLERMLRIHFLKRWFDLSDPAVKGTLYDSRAKRAFKGIDLRREPILDETTVMRFRHPLEQHELGARIFEAVGQVLQRRGLRPSKGTIVDTTIIVTPSSTRNAAGEHDPQMGQTWSGEQWYFGMNSHVDVDGRSKVVHAVAVTPANVAVSRVL